VVPRVATALASFGWCEGWARASCDCARARGFFGIVGPPARARLRLMRMARSRRRFNGGPAPHLQMRPPAALTAAFLKVCIT